MRHSRRLVAFLIGLTALTYWIVLSFVQLNSRTELQLPPQISMNYTLLSPYETSTENPTDNQNPTATTEIESNIFESTSSSSLSPTTSSSTTGSNSVRTKF